MWATGSGEPDERKFSFIVTIVVFVGKYDYLCWDALATKVGRGGNHQDTIFNTIFFGLTMFRTLSKKKLSNFNPNKVKVKRCLFN